VLENYFNYFTEIEECYRRCRNTPSLLSPLDWALIESWKEADIPLAAALAGIERSFAKFQKRPQGIQRVNSLAYCTQQVMKAAEEMQDSGSGQTSAPGAAAADAAPFSSRDLEDFFSRSAEALARAADTVRAAGQADMAEDLERAVITLQSLAPPQGTDAPVEFEDLERKLSSLEDILHSALLRATSVDLLADFKADVARGLGSARRNMSAHQIESLERQFLKKRLFEHYRVPRLSLFYL
jgi:hypothetical protein